jgi:hypothetical protein
MEIENDNDNTRCEADPALSSRSRHSGYVALCESPFTAMRGSAIGTSYRNREGFQEQPAIKFAAFTKYSLMECSSRSPVSTRLDCRLV